MHQLLEIYRGISSRNPDRGMFHSNKTARHRRYYVSSEARMLLCRRQLSLKCIASNKGCSNPPPPPEAKVDSADATLNGWDGVFIDV